MASRLIVPGSAPAKSNSIHRTTLGALTAPPAAAPLPFIHPDDMPDQYALTGVGRCMEPLIGDGTLLVFDKHQEPQRGDIVGLVFTQEAARRWGAPGLLKRLTFALPPSDLPPGCHGLVVVEQINPPRQYTIPAGDILAVHKAIGTAERDGEGRAQFRPSKVEAWT